MRTPQILVIAAALLVASRVHADEASTLKQQGLKAAQDKNWDVARERFEQSYALDPRPLTLFNLAVAQEHSGKLVDARESYAAFLEQSTTADAAQFRKLAKDAIPALDKAIPTLHIRATGLATGDVIEVNGREASTAAPIALDPGDHIIIVRRSGEPIAQRTVTLARAARDDVEIAVPVPVPRVDPTLLPTRPPPEPAPRIPFERTQPPPPRESSSVLRSRWFWGVTAAVVLAGAGATYYYLSAPTQDPMRGTLGPGVVPVP